MKVNFKITSVLTVLILASAFYLNAQNNVRELSNIVDMRASGLDRAMENNGYTHVKTDKSDMDAYSYWWNNRRNKCVTVRTSGGIVKSVVSTLPADCNKSMNNSNSSNNYRNDTEKQAYMRGYNHGKRNLRKDDPYSSNIQINAYARGYSDGRSGKPVNSYYSGGNNSGNRGGAKWRDLEGWVATSAYDVLKHRGFVEVKDHKDGGKTYRVWYHNRTRQCIKTLSVDKKIKEIMESDRCD